MSTRGRSGATCGKPPAAPLLTMASGPPDAGHADDPAHVPIEAVAVAEVDCLSVSPRDAPARPAEADHTFAATHDVGPVGEDAVAEPSLHLRRARLGRGGRGGGSDADARGDSCPERECRELFAQAVGFLMIFPFLSLSAGYPVQCPGYGWAFSANCPGLPEEFRAPLGYLRDEGAGRGPRA